MKSRGRRKGRAPTGARPASVGQERTGAAASRDAASRPPAVADPGANATTTAALDRWFIPIALATLIVAAAIRLPQLALNPYHHDEGVNGWFMTNLVRSGAWSYDPANYHGPSLYYFALLSEILFGLTDEAMRLVPVVFGIILVGAALALRPYLGSLAVIVAGTLLAVSPGAVYVSRYFIHETLLVAFSLCLFVALVYYLDRREAKYLLAAAVAASLLFATKETGIITVAVLVIATVVGHFYVRWRRQPAVPARGVKPRAARSSTDVGESLLPRWIPGEHLAGGAVVFLVIYVLLYSSFFRNFPQGLIDSLATFTIWTQTGGETQTQPFQQYLAWMVPLDVVILVLGVAGGLVAAIRAPSRLWVIIGLWAAGITLAYSIISYKTPWIILNMLVPLALLAGLALTELWRSRQLRLGVPVVLAAAIATSAYQAVDLNYSHYDDPTYSYVFVHSTRSMLDLMDEVDATAERAGTGLETGVVIVAPEYWPLPWYFRDYPRAGFYGQITETEEAMIIANVNQEAELAPMVEGRYERVGVYTLRPGIDLALYVRNDVPKA